MDLIEIKPSSTLQFVLPDLLTCTFTLYNVTLHQLDVKLCCTHPTNFIVSPNKFTMDSFDEKVVRVQLKYYQQSAVSNFLANKMVLYIYDKDQEGELWGSDGISVEKFKRIQKVEFQLSCSTNMQDYSLKQPTKKEQIIRMQKLSDGPVSSLDKAGVINYLESLGNLESFHSLTGDVFLARYKSLSQAVSQIRETEGSNGNMLIYAVGVQPWMVYPEQEQPRQVQEASRNSLQSSPKSTLLLKSKPSRQLSNNESDNQNPCSYQDAKQEVSNLQQPKVNGDQTSIEAETYQSKKQQIGPNSIQPGSLTNHSVVAEHLQPPCKQESKATASTSPKPRRGNIFESFAQNDPKKSFAKRSGRRNKSVDIKARKASEQIVEEEGDDQDYGSLFVPQQRLNVARTSQKQQIKQQPCIQNVQIINSIIKPINFLILPQGKFLILFQGFVMVYHSIDKIGNGERFQLGTLNCWTQKKTVIKHTPNHLVVSCDSNFFVVDVKTKKCSSAFVQRKQILDLLVHQKEDIIIFAGRTFSKLSLFGKQTARSNIKTYSLSTQYHLLTFDMPKAGDIYHLGEFGSANNNILATLGNDGRVTTIYFMSIVNANKLQVLSHIDMEDLGVAEIKGLSVCDKSIYILEDLKSQQVPLMFVKRLNIRSQDKPTVSTESLPIAHGSYQSLTMDSNVIILRDNINMGLLVYELKKRRSFRVPFEGQPQKMQVGFPYLFLMYQTHMDVKRFKGVHLQ